MLRVEVYDTHTILWQSINQLKLCAEDIIHRVECLEVHLANSRYDTDCGVYQIANLLYVAGLLCAHLDNENLMIGLQLLTNGADNTQSGVEISGCHQHIILLGEYAVEVILG